MHMQYTSLRIGQDKSGSTIRNDDKKKAVTALPYKPAIDHPPVIRDDNGSVLHGQKVTFLQHPDFFGD
jgi:hypothetical protein